MSRQVSIAPCSVLSGDPRESSDGGDQEARDSLGRESVLFDFFNQFFEQKPPIQVEDRLWIEGRLRWLENEFGSRRKVIEPTLQFFPGSYNGSDASIRELFSQVCIHFGMPHKDVRLSLFEAGEAGGMLMEGQNTAGLYTGGYPFNVAINTRGRRSQTAMVATMVHELCHVRLMGENYVEPDIPDNEELTDLATLHFGFGIFTANSRFLKLRTVYGTQGYLPNTMISYALALMQTENGDSKPDWLAHLNGTSRSIYKRSVCYLEQVDPS